MDQFSCLFSQRFKNFSSLDLLSPPKAEEAIKTLPTVEGGPAALLQIVGAGEQVAKEVRQAAAIAFKNIAKQHWEPMGGLLGGPGGLGSKQQITKEQCVPDPSKPALRDMLFQVLLVEGDKAVRDQLAESVNQVRVETVRVVAV
jgi:hypothetical protein